MYYNQPSPATQTHAQFQSWEEQQLREEAMERAGKYYRGQGWDPVDAQQIGNIFKVHLYDRNGNYHTVELDPNGNILQNQTGYQ